MKRGFLSLMVCLMMMLSAIGGVNAMKSGPIDEPYMLFIFCHDGKDQSVGDTVTVDVHFFVSGEPMDAEEAWVLIGPVYDDPRNQTLEHVSTGVYSAEIVLAQEDVSSRTLVYVNAAVNYEGETVRTDDHINIWLKQEERVMCQVVVLDPDDRYPVPGQTIEYEVWFTKDGEMFDIAADDIRIGNTTDPHRGGPRNFTTLGPGRFGGSVSVPVDQKVSEYYWVNVRYPSREGDISHQLDCIARLTFFNYWVHAIEISENRSTIEVIITDNDGLPMEGASVNLTTYSNRDPNATGITDANGRTIITVAHWDHSGSWSSLFGNVSHNGYLQNVMGDQHIIEDPDESRPDDGIHPRRITKDPLPAATPIELEYILLYRDEPVEGRLFHYYVYDHDGLYWYGSLTSDADGKFSMAFTTPEVSLETRAFDTFYLYYHYTIEDRWYQSVDRIYIGNLSPDAQPVPDEPVTISHTPIIPGKEVTVTMTVDKADGMNESAFILWALGEDPDRIDSALVNLGLQREHGLYEGGWDTYHQGENCRMGSESAIYFVVRCNWEDGAYTGKFTVPDFLSEGIELYIKGEWVELFPIPDPIFDPALIQDPIQDPIPDPIPIPDPGPILDPDPIPIPDPDPNPDPGADPDPGPDPDPDPSAAGTEPVANDFDPSVEQVAIMLLVAVILIAFVVGVLYLLNSDKKGK